MDKLRAPVRRCCNVMERGALRAAIAAGNWFQGAPDGVIDQLVEAAVYRELPAGSSLWSMGETNTELFGIVSGRVRMYAASAMGQEFALVDREQGAWLGEACLKDDRERVIGARTETPAEILVIPRKVLLEIGQGWPQLYQNLFIHQVTTSRGLYELLSGMSFYPLRARLAGRLLELLEEHGQQVEGGVLIDIKLSQNDFARLAMGSRQRVNRIFREWDKRGLVVTRDDLLLICDIEQLELELQPFE